jgi:hypothetical protein
VIKKRISDKLRWLPDDIRDRFDVVPTDDGIEIIVFYRLKNKRKVFWLIDAGVATITDTKRRTKIDFRRCVLMRIDYDFG